MQAEMIKPNEVMDYIKETIKGQMALREQYETSQIYKGFLFGKYQDLYLTLTDELQDIVALKPINITEEYLDSIRGGIYQKGKSGEALGYGKTFKNIMAKLGEDYEILELDLTDTDKLFSGCIGDSIYTYLPRNAVIIKPKTVDLSKCVQLVDGKERYNYKKVKKLIDKKEIYLIAYIYHGTLMSKVPDEAKIEAEKVLKFNLFDMVNCEGRPFVEQQIISAFWEKFCEDMIKHMKNLKMVAKMNIAMRAERIEAKRKQIAKLEDEINHEKLEQNCLRNSVEILSKIDFEEKIEETNMSNAD